MDTVNKWLKSDAKDQPIQLDRCNVFQRRLLYQEVKNHFSEEDLYMEPINKVFAPGKRPERIIQISKTNKEEQKNKVKLISIKHTYTLNLTHYQGIYSRILLRP